MALKGIKVIEMMGLAPGPLCGTILADFGAAVTVVQKIESSPFNVMCNGKKMLSVNLKTEEGVKILRRLCASSDVLLDTFRPGVMESLDLGPAQLLKENSRLIYARLTGYGQDGFFKAKAGHDINYAAMSGFLSLLTRNKQPPVPPVNILADFAGGSFVCALGILLALFERTKSGKGQVVDVSMAEGLAYVSTWFFKSRQLPIWAGEPGTNPLDGGNHFYRTYKTKDDKFMAVGALEPQFYSNLLKALKLPENEYSQISDGNRCTEAFEKIFLTKTQEEWCQVFESADACVTPVLELDSIDRYKYYAGKNSFYRDDNGDVVPESAPKLSDTPGASVGRKPSPGLGEHTIEILKEMGYSSSDIDSLINKGCVYANKKANL